MPTTVFVTDDTLHSFRLRPIGQAFRLWFSKAWGFICLIPSNRKVTGHPDPIINFKDISSSQDPLNLFLTLPVQRMSGHLLETIPLGKWAFLLNSVLRWMNQAGQQKRQKLFSDLKGKRLILRKKKWQDKSDGVPSNSHIQAKYDDLPHGPRGLPVISGRIYLLFLFSTAKFSNSIYNALSMRVFSLTIGYCNIPFYFIFSMPCNLGLVHSVNTCNNYNSPWLHHI